ncbi:MATE family efflux transporter [Dorea longicatena]|uniref:MATE family efflux transporter n=1 Tax=Dorea longicatena TaxID=88431 RepID=UPI00156E730C|nr:MATE family efflux transporter [Dorea longicatena]NSC48867.1 MATE family efflux transporter [Dorea longicatena]NSD25012.1 MATE family efflux transporter [Dorea longicatena]NSD40631.1 MATE family efflux transporter [Dorea longicatena]NSD69582.1 MATE family efflux transporter [Dorea longicatena]NSD72546.1 MATE family efflux transporter [Dorea longicatena]
MKEQKKVNPLATESEGKLIAKFAIPAIISMLVSSLYNIVDQIFIGQGVGLLGNAATNIAFPVSIICTATALLLGIGSASNFNLCSGAGDHEKASRIAGIGLSMLVICGVIIAAVVLVFLDPLLHLFGVTTKILPYAQDYTGITAFGIPFLILTTGGNHLIRADRSPTYSMTCMLTGAIINTVLDPLFIFGFHWGIKGAAWATVIGQIVSGIMVIVYFGRFRKMELKKEMFRPRGHLLKMILSLGMASCINQIAMAVVQITMNNTLRYYGAASAYGTDIPLACVGVISKVNMVFMAIAIGISQGCQPIWGYNYGAGSYDRVKRTYWKAFRVAMTVGIVFFLCFQFFPTQLVSIFGTGSKEYYEFAARYFRIFMFMTFVNGIQPMSSGFFTSIGKAKLGIVVSLTRQVIFLLPLILIFPIFMGIDGVMYAGPIADAAAGIVAIGFAVKEIRAMDKIA